MSSNKESETGGSEVVKALVDSSLDICACGDYRRDHEGNDGPCKLRGGPHAGFRCDAFRFSHTAPQKETAQQHELDEWLSTLAAASSASDAPLSSVSTESISPPQPTDSSSSPAITLEEIEGILAYCNAATQGPWEKAAISNDGSYGSGPDVRSGFDSYIVTDPNGNLLFDTLNSTAATIHEEIDEDGPHVWDDVGRDNSEFAVHARTDLPRLCTELKRLINERGKSNEM